MAKLAKSPSVHSRLANAVVWNGSMTSRVANPHRTSGRNTRVVLRYFGLTITNRVSNCIAQYSKVMAFGSSPRPPVKQGCGLLHEIT